MSVSDSKNAGDLVGKYFANVLGVRTISSVTGDAIRAAMPAARGHRHVLAAGERVCLLIEVGRDSETPSILEMGARLVEAIRSEWLKYSTDQLPSVEWLRAEDDSWSDAIQDRGSGVVLAIVSGARQSVPPDSDVIHVYSFAEMQDSHVLKREAWRAIQHSISVLNRPG